MEVFFGVYADGVEGGLGYVDGDVVFKEAKLFQALCELQRAGREGVEEGQRGGAVGVESQMLPDGWVNAVAVVGQGGAGEVEGSAVQRGDYLYGVGVGYVVGGTEDFEGCDLG